MATIISPTRGQPLDVTLISSLVEAVSDLQNSQITSTQSRVNGVAANSSSLKFYAETKSITINNITTSPEEKFFFTYPNYTSTPIAVVGLTNSTSTVSGGNAATAVLTSVTKDRVDGIIKFPSGSTGSVTMQINLIAIGIS
jgi:hypothetical protein